MGDQDTTLTERRAEANRRRQKAFVRRQQASGRLAFRAWVSRDEAKMLREALADYRGKTTQQAAA